MASFPIVEITDGTTTASLLGPFLALESWRPAIAQAKGGGTFQSSPLADGRRLVNRRFDNVVETFDLSASATTQDGFAEQHQELERLLEKATQYWTTSWQNTPVYLVAKTPCETEARHALIYNYSLPDLNQILRRPFAGKTPGMVDFSMSIERGHWGADIPGEETCVEISGMGAEGHVSSVARYSSLYTDDANYSPPGGFTTLAATIVMGDVGGNPFDGIFLARSIDVPQGSIIVQANIRLKAHINDAGASVFQVQGEASDNAETLSTEADWLARSMTANAVAWNPGAWVANIWYTSPDISTVVQEIINRPGWVSGNNMLIEVADNGSPLNAKRQCYPIDDPVEVGAELDVMYISSDDAGREATCDPEVFIANKHNYRGLTHIWWDQPAGVGFSVNLLNEAFPLPKVLLPAVPAVNDVLYFGIEDGPLGTITGGGPFWSLVLDLVTAQTGVTFGNGWEFWNGAWAALAPIQDNTDTGGQPLDTTGVNSVHWSEEAAWATRAINGVTGYWVRLLVTAVAAPTPPTQQNRDIYTILWPYVEIDNAQVEGDITALLRALLNNQSWDDIGRVVMGLRSIERGPNFTPYLNCSDQQEIPGISFNVAGGATLPTNVQAPTERALQWAPGGAVVMASRGEWTFTAGAMAGGTVSPDQWYGSFHVFARVRQTAGADDNFEVGLQIDIGGATYTSSTNAIVRNALNIEVLDLGRVDIPDGTGVLNTAEVLDTLIISIQSSALAAGTLVFYDFAFMPADEMLIDAQIPTMATDELYTDEELSIDSVVYPKATIRSLVRNEDDRVLTIWRTKGAQAFLQSNTDQRLWFFMMNYLGAAPAGWVSLFSMSARPQAFANRRYLALRGER